MPRLHEMLEIKFVSVDWTHDPRGYTHVVVDDPIVIDYYQRMSDRQLVEARDRVRLCDEIGHMHEHGCGGVEPDGVPRCVVWLHRVEASSYAPSRPQLVRITIPLDS